VKVVLADDAKNDLEDIADFIAQDDARRAASVVKELDAKARELAIFPRRFPLVPELVQFEVRRRLHHGYLIFYRIFDEHVLVLRILHGSRDHLPLFDAGN
jgi:toxin ParE1/3/4